jgi:short subunit fatty acids transporter
MNRAFVLVSLALVLVFVVSCIPGPNTLANSPTEEGKVAGFWQGLWNGIIAPLTFIISLFSRNVQMYEVHNNGGWYNLGFLLGMSIILGGGGGGAARKRSRH